MRRVWGLLVVLLALAGCAEERVGGHANRTQAPTGAFDVAAPIEFAPVAETETETTTELVDVDGAPLYVEEPFLTITRVEHAEVSMQGTTWGLLITMTKDDGDVFGEWTESHIGERVAMIVAGEVASAPMIQSAIPGGEVVIAGDYTQSEAQALLHKITGR